MSDTDLIGFLAASPDSISDRLGLLPGAPDPILGVYARCLDRTPANRGSFDEVASLTAAVPREVELQPNDPDAEA